MNDTEAVNNAPRKGFSGIQVALIVLGVIVVTAGVTFLFVRTYIFPQELEPVTLTSQEEQRLDSKLRRLGWNRPQPSTAPSAADQRLEPEPYSEAAADREIRLSERELNALIASDPELAKRVAIDLSDNLASAKILMPVPEDFPTMAGKTLRVDAGLELSLSAARQPVVKLRGVSVMGVPVPNAWLGNLKNVDLVGEFGDQGFWRAFADGVENVQIRDGELYIKLRE